VAICEARHQVIDGKTQELTCVLLADIEPLEGTHNPFSTRTLLIYREQRLYQWNETPAGYRTEVKPTLILIPVHLITQWIKAFCMVVPDVFIICNYYGDYRNVENLVVDEIYIKVPSQLNSVYLRRENRWQMLGILVCKRSVGRLKCLRTYTVDLLLNGRRLLTYENEDL